MRTIIPYEENQVPNFLAKDLHVLIIEDDLSLEPVWDSILKSIDPGATYSWATSEPEAQEIVKQTRAKGQNFDLVLSDVFVSGSKTGLDFFESADEELRNRIVLVSGVSRSRLKEYLGTNFKSNQVIQKPVKIIDGIAVIKSILRRQSREFNPSVAHDEGEGNDREHDL